MRGKKNDPLSFYKYMILVLSGASLIIFLVAAVLCSIFGYSLWSWMNILRFILGGFIVFLVIAYFAIIRILVQNVLQK